MLTFLAVAQAAADAPKDDGWIFWAIVLGLLLLMGGGTKAATGNKTNQSQPKESEDWVPIRLRDSSGRVTTYETPRSSLRAQGAPGTRSGSPIKPGEIRLR